MRLTRTLSILLAASLAAGCDDAPGAPTTCPCAAGWTCCPGQDVCVSEAAECPSALAIEPAELTTTTLRIESFTASAPVLWSIEEGEAGGTIDQDGQYVPPLAPGTYHVVATGLDGVRASAAVTVASLRLDLVAGELGGDGDADGAGTDARFAPDEFRASGLVADGDGHLYAADTANHKVRVVELTTGETSVVAELPRPTGLALADGALFAVSDETIYRIDLETGQMAVFVDEAAFRVDGVIEGAVVVELISDGAGTLWGILQPLAAGQLVFRLDIATKAVTHLTSFDDVRFTDLGGLTYLPFSGFLLVATNSTSVPRQLYLVEATTGDLITQASGYQPTESVSSLLYQPDASGQQILYVAEGAGVRAVDLGDSRSVSLVLAGQRPTALAPIAPGRVAVLDGAALYELHHGPPAPTIARIAGFESHAADADGRAGGAHFARPTGMVAVGDRVYVADHGNRKVRTVDLPDGVAATFAADLPVHAVLPIGDSLIMGRTRVSLPSGDLLGELALPGEPFGLAADPSDPEGSLFAGYTAGACTPFVPCGAIAHVDLATGEVRSVASDLRDPAGLVADREGHLYVTEGGLDRGYRELLNTREDGYERGRLLRIDIATGEITEVAGGSPGFADGGAEDSRLASPAGMAIDRIGRIYIADSGNGAIRRYDPRTGLLETVAGAGLHGVRLGAAGTFNVPQALAFTSRGDLLVLDREESSLLLLH